MKQNFFKQLADFLRQLFKKEEKEATFVIAEQQEAIAETETAVEEKAVKDIARDTSEKCVKQMRCFLFKGDKPIGKPFGRRSEIRVVYVNNFVESFQFFLRLCDQRLLTFRQTGGHLDCTATFPDGSGNLTFTDKVTCRNKAVIAVLKIEIISLQSQLSEIRFEIKH